MLTLYSKRLPLVSARFDIKKHCILPTQRIYVFRTILTINSDCFPKRNQPFGRCHEEALCFL
jgi:hypothetical protein